MKALLKCRRQRFFESEEKGVVVCVALFEDSTAKYPELIQGRGIAKCSSEDKFDLDTGRRLAYLRAKQEALNKLIAFYKDGLQDELKFLHELTSNLDYLYEERDQVKLKKSKSL